MLPGKVEKKDWVVCFLLVLMMLIAHSQEWL